MAEHKFTQEAYHQREENRRKRMRVCPQCKTEKLMRGDQTYCSPKCRAAAYTIRKSEEFDELFLEVVRLREKVKELETRLGEGDE